MKIFYFFFLSLSTFSALAQVASCTLDPTFIASNKKGIWPDSATNFLQGTVGIPYTQNLTVKVPKDTVVSPITMCFNRVEVSSPTGVTNFNLPPGINMLAGNNVTVAGTVFKFPGNANTCASLTGTPTTAGSYTLQFKVQPYLTPSGGSCSSSPNVGAGSSSYASPTTLAYYIIKINAPAGVNENISGKSFNLCNAPNPFSEKTTVSFQVQDESTASIRVYNLLGSKIFEEKFTTRYGDNSFELDGACWGAGIYIYTVQYKQHTETKRLVVNSTR
jgi:hypothetical protein